MANPIRNAGICGTLEVPPQNKTLDLTSLTFSQLKKFEEILLENNRRLKEENLKLKGIILAEILSDCFRNEGCQPKISAMMIDLFSQ